MHLGLDIGSNSIGFAIRNNEGFIKAGSFIFSSGRDEKSKVSLASARRQKKGARRLIKQKQKRQIYVLKTLQENGLFPISKSECEALKLENPYKLRATGAVEMLPKYHLGRALMNLTVKRGFKSNKIEEEGEDKKKAEGLKLKQNRLDKILNRLNITLGQFLHLKQKKGKILKQSELNPYNALRKHYEVEFKKLKEVHQSYLSDDVWSKIHHFIFHQNPLKEQNLGKCIFDGEARTRKFMPSFQYFKVLQTVNNIKIKGATSQKEPLSKEQRQILTAKLREDGFKLSQNSVKKALGFGKSTEIILPIRDSKEGDLGGDETYPKMLKIIPNWGEFSLAKQDEIMQNIYDEKYENLPENVQTLTFKPKEIKTASLSLNVITKIIPFLEEGFLYHEAMEKAGFNHSTGDAFDPTTGELLNPEKYTAHNELPHYSEVLTESLGANGEIANPTTHIILNNLRRLVNEVIKKYGKPATIHLELAREIGLGAEGLTKLIREQNAGEKENAKLNERLKKLGERESHENRLKLKLFDELPLKKCVYSGRQLTEKIALSSEVEVEHILPYSKTFDNSKSNLCLAFKEFNAKKGNNSPFEAFGEECYLRAKELFEKIPPKLWRFEADAMERYIKNPEIAKKKLHDTKHASRLARKYLQAICPDVICIKGEMTGMVRNLCGFNSILSDDAEKNRNDHRHHALDACFLTLIDRSFQSHHFPKLMAKTYKEKKNDEKILELKSHHNSIANAVQDITVFHKPKHKLFNSFHEETIYSPKTRIIREIATEEFISEFGKSLHYENIIKQTLRETLEGLVKSEFNEYFKAKDISHILITEEPEGVVKSRTSINDIKEKDIPNIVDKNLRDGVSNYIKDLTESPKEDDFADLIEKDKTLAKKPIKELGIIKFFKNTLAKKLKILYTQSFSIKISNERLVKPEFSHLAVFSLPKTYDKMQMESHIKHVKETYGCLTEITKEGLAVVGVYKTFIGKFLNVEKTINDNISKTKKTINYNKIRPHPSSKLLFKLQTKDVIKALPKGGDEEVLFRISSVSPVNRVFSGLKVNYAKTQNASGYDISIVFNDIKKCQVRPVFVSPLGEVKDNNKWYKK